MKTEQNKKHEYKYKPVDLLLRHTDIHIPKKSGGKRTINVWRNKFRTYHEVNRAKKELELLKVHKNASAYKKDTSIIKTMNKHAKHKYLMKFDFTNFFGSFPIKEAEKKFIKLGVTAETFSLLLSAHSYSRDKEVIFLGQGLPLSPLATNILMYEFDRELTKQVRKFKGEYSRYADDIIISTDNNLSLSWMQNKILGILKDLKMDYLKLNTSKTKKYKVGGKVKALGLTIAADNRVTVGAKYRKSIINKIRLYEKALTKTHFTKSIAETAKIATTYYKAIWINQVCTENKIDLKPFEAKLIKWYGKKADFILMMNRKLIRHKELSRTYYFS